MANRAYQGDCVVCVDCFDRLQTPDKLNDATIGPNNRFTGLFSWINPYRRPFFLINCCHRGLSGIFSVLITSERVLLGVYQAFLARHRPDAWSIALSSVRV